MPDNIDGGSLMRQQPRDLSCVAWLEMRLRVGLQGSREAFRSRALMQASSAYQGERIWCRKPQCGNCSYCPCRCTQRNEQVRQIFSTECSTYCFSASMWHKCRVAARTAEMLFLSIKRYAAVYGKARSGPATCCYRCHNDLRPTQKQ